MKFKSNPNILLGLIAIAAVVIAWPHLFLRGQIPIDGNVLRLLFPNRVFLHAHPPLPWNWPLWNPYRNMGEPFLADPVTMTTYPPVWILAHVRSILSFFQLWVMGHTLMAGLFMGLWVYRKSSDRSGAIAAALVVMFNGFFMSRVTLAHHFASAAYVPVILYFFDAGRVVPFAIALALQWLAGFPSFSYITVLSLGAWTLLQPREKWRLFVMGGGLALCLAAILVIPFLELLSLSIRHVVLNAQMALEYSEPWRQLVKIMVIPQWFAWRPQVSGDQAVVSFYVGPLVLLLAFWGAWVGTRLQRILLCGIFLSVLLSLGGYLPGYHAVPFFRIMRYPANWLLIASVGLAYLCGMGVSRLRTQRLKGILIGLIAIDLLCFAHYVRVPWFEESYLTQEPALVRTLKENAAIPRLYVPPIVTSELSGQGLRTVSDFDFFKQSLTPSYGMAFGLREVWSYQILELKRAERLQSLLFSQGPTSPWLQWAGVTAVITKRQGSVPWGPENMNVISLKDFKLPMFLLHEKPGDRVEPLSRRADRIEAIVRLDHDDLLVFSEMSYPGWSVRVDGVRQDLTMFEEAFLAVRLSPGEHRVEFRFVSRSFWLGFWISVLAVALLFVLRVRRLYGRRAETVRA